MAVTDEQLDDLCDYAEQMGYDGVLLDPHDSEVVDAVFDWADITDMRTEDEWDRVITPNDLPDEKDHERIVKSYEAGVRRADEEQSVALGRRDQEGM